MKEKYEEFFSWLYDGDCDNITSEFDIATGRTIYYSDEMKKIIDTAQMQRLKRIMQLSTVIIENDNAYHTRYDHSIGTYNNGVLLFMQQYSNEAWRQTHEDRKKEIRATLIELLTHDIGHLTFSHTLEDLIGTRGAHEIISRRIIDEVFASEGLIDEEVFEIIKKHREDINRSTIEDGNIDLDRMDYLIHDSIYLDENDQVDVLMDNVLASISLEDKERIDIPSFEEDSIGLVQDFLRYREKQYRKYYHSNHGITYDTLCLAACKNIYLRGDKSSQEFYDYLENAITNRTNLDLNEHLTWTDLHTLNGMLDVIEKSDDKDLVELVKMSMPTLDGLVNVLYKMTEYPLEEGKTAPIDSIGREFYEKLRKYVKSTNLSPRESIIKRDLMPNSDFRNQLEIYDFSKEEYDSVVEELNRKGLPQTIMGSIIWQRKVKKYSSGQPSFIKDEKGNEIEVTSHPDFNLNIENEMFYGGFIFDPYLRLEGLTESQIVDVKEAFGRVKQKEKPKKLMRKYTHIVDENADMYLGRGYINNNNREDR